MPGQVLRYNYGFSISTGLQALEWDCDLVTCTCSIWPGLHKITKQETFQTEVPRTPEHPNRSGESLRGILTGQPFLH